MRVQRLATVPVFAETLTVLGPYLPHHWSEWPNILDLVLWVPKQHVYQVSLKSETVGFNSLGDLTQNDPKAIFLSPVLCVVRLFRSELLFLMAVPYSFLFPCHVL